MNSFKKHDRLENIVSDLITLTNMIRARESKHALNRLISLIVKKKRKQTIKDFEFAEINKSFLYSLNYTKNKNYRALINIQFREFKAFRHLNEEKYIIKREIREIKNNRLKTIKFSV